MCKNGDYLHTAHFLRSPCSCIRQGKPVFTTKQNNSAWSDILTRYRLSADDMLGNEKMNALFLSTLYLPVNYFFYLLLKVLLLIKANHSLPLGAARPQGQSRIFNLLFRQ